MGDSTTLTIEFLRARLHSERSVSRVARRRSAQLSKRVTKLEEQLKIMILQRNKAVKAAAKLLTILGTQAADDLFRVADMTSYDENIQCELIGHDDSSKEDGTSTSSRMGRGEVDDEFAVSQFQVLPTQSRSLCTKGCGNSPDSHQQQKVTNINETQSWGHLSFAVGSLQEHHLRNSCKKIKQRKTRSAVAIRADKSSLLDAHNKGEDKKDKHEEMKGPLAQQAEPLCQYQAEENAQREGKEKHNVNKRSTLDYCEPRCHTLLEDNSCEPKAEAVIAGERNQQHDKVAKSGAENKNSNEETTIQSLPVATDQRSRGRKLDESKASTAAYPNGTGSDNPIATTGSSSHACTDGLAAPKHNDLDVNETETSSQEFTFPAQGSFVASARGEQIQGLLCDNTRTDYTSNSRLQWCNPTSVYSTSKFPIWGYQRKPPQSPSGSLGLGSAAQVHQDAKASLRHRPHELPLQSRGTLEAAPSAYYHRTRTIKPGDALDIPMVPAGLFRLQSDSSLQAKLSGPKFYNSGLGSTAGRRESGHAISVRGYHLPTTTSYMGSEMPASTMWSLPRSNLAIEREPSHHAPLKTQIPAQSLHSDDRKASNSIIWRP